ncbi:Npr3 [Kluyveromyces lactis]|nr:Npr3 [Kluyveromyces lactis]
MSTNLPNSCLVQIALTVSTHSGPQLIYHYPPSNYTTATSSKKTHHSDIKKRYEYTDSENNSSSDDYSSGLSDSELSTDYADCSSDASESSLDSFPQLNHDDTVNSSTNNTFINNGLRSRQSQISANKLFQVLNQNNNNVAINGENSLRESLHSIKTSTNMSSTTDPRPEDELDAVDEELKILVDDLLDGSIFQQDTFQDTSKVLNFNTEFVAELCSPRKEMCNTRFEFTVDDLCFLGLPIHADHKGRWKKSKKRKQASKRSARSSTARNSISRNSIGRNSISRNRSKTESQGRINDVEEPADDENSDYEPSKSEMLNEMYCVPDAENDEFESLQQSINMFQVCFIMNPKIIEYNERVDDMYHYVVTRLSLILRYIQGKTGYVTRECVKIMKCKDEVSKHSRYYESLKSPWSKGKYMYERILYESSLARALTKCFNCIHNNEIANLEIDGDKIVSLQIPIKNEFSILPNLKEDAVLRGSFLSSVLNESFIGRSTSLTNDDSDNLYANHDRLLDYGLLLLDEPENIIKGLENASFDNGVTDLLLINLVRQLKPTIRLGQYKLLIKELIDSNDSSYDDQFCETTLKSLCLHLIYWRHARLILPISSRNTYIVSPLAPISGFSTDDFKHGEYNTLIRQQEVPVNNNDEPSLIYQNKKVFNEKFPSLPSLPSFLQLISTQKPRPFGHIIPSNEHKSMYLNALAWLMRYGYLTQLLTFVYVRVDKRIKIAVDEDLEKDDLRSNKNEKSGNFVTGGENYNSNEFDDLEMINDNDFTIILEPERNTALEKRWLYKCAEALPSDLQTLFRQVVKYFNGKVSLEYIMIKEGIPKHEIKRLLQALGKYVVEVKHW